MLQLELSVPVPIPGAAVVSPLPASSAAANQPDADRTSSTGSGPKRSSKAIYALSIAAILSGLGIAGYSSFKQKAPPVAVQVAHSAKSNNASDRGPTARAAGSEQNAVLPASTDSTAFKPANAGSTGTLRLNIKPWGTVYVDGVSKGVSPPLKKLQLPEGKHEIKIVNPNFRSHTIEIDVTKKKTGIIQHDFSPIKK